MDIGYFPDFCPDSGERLFFCFRISLISVRKSRVRHLVKSGNPAARRVQKLQEEPERFLGTVQIGVTLVGTLASTLGGVIAIERITPDPGPGSR